MEGKQGEWVNNKGAIHKLCGKKAGGHGAKPVENSNKTLNHTRTATEGASILFKRENKLGLELPE